MLEIQKLLRSGVTPEGLKETLAIKSHVHPHLPITGFTYNQIDSPKLHPIVREARGIALENGTWNIVAKAFSRFFNLGEVQEEAKTFDWTDFTCYTKADGTLILLYCYKGEWQVKTRGSFAGGTVPFPLPTNPKQTFSDLFWDTFNKRTRANSLNSDGLDELNPSYTYVLELCTVQNKVVRTYPDAALFLLSVTNNTTAKEFSDTDVDLMAHQWDVNRPDRHRFHSVEEIKKFLKKKEDDDPSYEGVVVRDSKGLRYKIKSETYLALHHMCDNGALYRPKRLVPFALKKDPSELLLHFAEAKPYLDYVVDKVDVAWVDLVALWEEHHSIENQKEFALAIAKQSAFISMLFRLRKSTGTLSPAGGFLPGKQTKEQLREIWRNSADSIAKVLFSTQENVALTLSAISDKDETCKK